MCAFLTLCSHAAWVTCFVQAMPIILAFVQNKTIIIFFSQKIKHLQSNVFTLHMQRGLQYLVVCLCVYVSFHTYSGTTS